MSGSDASQQANRAEMDPKRLAVVAYLVLGFVVFLFLGELLELVFARVGVSNARLIEGLDFHVSELIALVATGGFAAWAWLNPATHAVSLETAAELMKVTWPSWDETRVSTVAVIVASLVSGAILFGIDSLAFKVMVQWLPKVWGLL